MMRTVLRAVCAAVAFVSVAFVAPSLQTYYGNTADTGFRATFVDTEYGLLALAAFVLAAGLPLVVPSRFRSLAISLVLALAGCLFLQQSLFAGGFGPVDGTKFSFQGIWLRSLAELTIWALVLAGGLLIGRRLADNAVFLALLLVAWAAVSGWHAVSQSQHLEAKQQASSPTAFALSKERNVVFWISDALQGDIAERILRDDQATRNTLKGFTYYPDATSHYKYTLFSVPTLLTGKLGDAYYGADDYVEEVRSRGNLSRTLRASGFDVNMVSTNEYCIAFETCDFYWKLIPLPDVDLRNRANLISLALFRITPAPLKPMVFNGVGGIGTRLLNGYSGNLRHRFVLSQGPVSDVFFFKRLIERMNVTAERPTFKVLHSRGSHAPYVLRPDCSPSELRETFEAVVEQSKCQIAVFVAFVERLKALGVYDNTTIVWVSDHGARAKYYRGDGQWLGNFQGDASATFAVKYAGAQHKFAFSEQAVQLVDVVPTILHELGVNSEGFDGQALQTLTDAPRARYFIDHKTYSRNARSVFDRYEIVGPRAGENSWTRLGTSNLAHANGPNRER